MDYFPVITQRDVLPIYFSFTRASTDAPSQLHMYCLRRFLRFDLDSVALSRVVFVHVRAVPRVLFF